MAITSSTILNLKYGKYKVCYHSTGHSQCLSFSKGDVSRGAPIIRIHSSCLFGETFHSLHCDCGEQLTKALRMIASRGAGVIVYTYSEGRGIGLEKKIKAMELERNKKINTIEAFFKLGYKKADLRSYTNEIQALRDLEVSKIICLISNNPQKRKALEVGGFVIKKIIKQRIKLNKYNKKEYMLKQKKEIYYVD